MLRRGGSRAQLVVDGEESGKWLIGEGDWVAGCGRELVEGLSVGGGLCAVGGAACGDCVLGTGCDDAVSKAGAFQERLCSLRAVPLLSD